MSRCVRLLVLAIVLTACGASPPPVTNTNHFVEAPIVPFHMTFADGTTLALGEDGAVRVNGDLFATLGADGRMEDPDGETLAALLPDGRLSFQGALTGATLSAEGITGEGGTMRVDGEQLVFTGDGPADGGSVPVVGVTPASRTTVLFVVSVLSLRVRAEGEAIRTAVVDGELDALVQDGEESRVQVPLGDRPVRGAATAPVVVAMFLDFQCPFCERVQPTLQRLARAYGDQVRFVFFHQPLPFHEHASDAATFAEEARAQRGDAGFWAAADLLFQNRDHLAREDLLRYAAQLGLDPARVDRALTTDAYRARLEADAALATRVGISGTPGFAIDGRILMGAQPYEQFAQVIDDELANVQRFERLGVARTAYYDQILAHALAQAPEPEPTPPPSPRRPTLDPTAVYAVPVDHRPARGPADALVTIVEFSDFQCPFCSRVVPTLETLRTEYGRDVRIVYRHNPLPFHEHAMEAAEAAEEAYAQRGDAGFWAMHDLLFANQTALERSDLEGYARQLHLSMPRFQHALDAHTHRAAIEADQALARQLGATGTPAFFLNGRNLRGAQPVEAFRALVDEVRAGARARVEAGTPRRQVYAALTAGGATSAVYLPGEAPADVAPPEDTRIYTIPVPPSAPAQGPASARVTVQVFSDFQCPFCSRVEPTLARLRQTYGDRIRIVWRNYPLPFHDHAQEAAEAAMEVYAQRGAEAFWSFHDVLFTNQRALSRSDLETYAAAVPGIDMARFRSALDDHRHAHTIQADQDAVRAAGAEIGTPTCFIEGHMVVGAQPYERFTAVIDPLLAAQ